MSHGKNYLRNICRAWHWNCFRFEQRLSDEIIAVLIIFVISYDKGPEKNSRNTRAGINYERAYANKIIQSLGQSDYVWVTTVIPKSQICLYLLNHICL